MAPPMYPSWPIAIDSKAGRQAVAWYVPTISRPSDPANEGWAGKTGRTEAILASICREFGLDPLDSVAYLCGNPDMTDYSAAVLAALGFPGGAVVRELYWAAREAG
jgi:NAD(P)H-flavin reductase